MGGRASRWRMAKARPRRRSPSTALRDRIVGWLQESGNYHNLQTVPGMEFAVQGSYPRPAPGVTPLGFFILKSPAERAIAIVANVGFSPQHKAALQTRTEPERAEFIRDLQLALMFHCGFAPQVDQKTREVIGLQFSEEIYFEDEVRREDLYSAIQRLFRAFVLVSLRLESLPPSAYLAR